MSYSGHCPGGKLSPSALEVDAKSGGYLSDIAADHNGKAGETLLLHKVPGIKAKRVVLMGVGKQEDRTDRTQRKVIVAGMGQIKALKLSNAVFALDHMESNDEDLYRQIRHNTEWASAELYQYDTTKSKKPTNWLWNHWHSAWTKRTLNWRNTPSLTAAQLPTV
ncbi:M17 family peptidase N-terminal domain-containing protein [Aliamphritea spongicola]